MKGTAADAFRAVLEGERIAVEFGRAAAQPEGGSTIALSDRVSLPVETAKRLVLALNEPLARLSRVQPSGDPARGETPVNAPPDPAGQAAALLLQLVGELGVPHQHERSFRVAAGALLANRFLLTLDARDIPGDPLARTLAICDRLQMPAALRAEAQRRFAMARCVHFGFEAGPGSVVCKLYLEREVPAEEAAHARAGHGSVLLHLAFKWDQLSGQQVTTQYLWYPATRVEDIEARLAQVYRGGEPAASLEIARAALALAAGRASAETLQYLEVQEPDNGRRSFDLNVYAANLAVKDAQPLLARMRDRFGLRPGEFQALYDQIKGRALGHLAGGVHRDGKDFFNVYYGVTGLPHFSARLA